MATRKFGRAYQMKFFYGEDTTEPPGPSNPVDVTITLGLPFTVEFDIVRHDFSSCNEATFRVYNLSPANRRDTRVNPWDFGHYYGIEFRAGYLSPGLTAASLPVAFSGNVHEGFSVRQGVDFITELRCFDGGFAFQNSHAEITLAGGASNVSGIQSLMSGLQNYGVTPGAIGNFPGSLIRGKPMTGAVQDLLAQETNDSWFVDLQKAYALRRAPYKIPSGGTGMTEALSSGGAVIPVINSSSGLLGTPIITQNGVEFDMLFEPSFYIAQQVELISIANDPVNQFNGLKRIMNVSHKGIISAAVCGHATTHVGLLNGPFTIVNPLTGGVL
jgi:hypothetical protein